MAVQKLIGLDFGTKAIKAVELGGQPGGGVTMNRFATAVVPGEQARLESLRTLVTDMRIGGARVATAVSGRNVIVRYVTMRQMSDEELKRTIPFEADKYIPFGMEEVVLDCQRLGEPGQGQDMRVVLVAVKRAFIEEQVRLLQEVGLRPVVVDVDCLALGNAFELTADPSGPDAERVVAVVDIGAASTNVDMIEGLATSWSRELYVAGDQFTENIARRLGVDYGEVEDLKRAAGEQEDEIREAIAPVLDDLRNEIMLTFDFYEGESEREVEALYFCGGSAGLPGLVEYFARVFDKPTELWDPTSRLSLKLPPADADSLGKHRHQAAVAIGLAGRGLTG
jgi:type IV pilus assembly protein PilM